MSRDKEKENEYLYSSARIRAVRAGEDRDLISRILDARNADDAIMLLHSTELGENVAEFSSYEAIFTTMLEEAYATVFDMIPCAGDLDFLRIKYDCNNIKIAIKSGLRDIDTRDMLCAVGTVPPDKIMEASLERDFSVLPENMARSADEALEVYAKTRDPQQIDFLLDGASACDMSAAAAGDEYATEYVRAKIDTTNILICLRVIRMKNDKLSKIMLDRALLPCGGIDRSFFYEMYDAGEGKLWETLAYRKYSGIVSSLPGGSVTLSEVERACENYIMTLVRGADYIPFGPPVLAAYLITRESEIKNLRIAIAGKLAKLSNEVIRERMRAV